MLGELLFFLPVENQLSQRQSSRSSKFIILCHRTQLRDPPTWEWDEDENTCDKAPACQSKEPGLFNSNQFPSICPSSSPTLSFLRSPSASSPAAPLSASPKISELSPLLQLVHDSHSSSSILSIVTSVGPSET